jgi:hypothetical protein
MNLIQNSLIVFFLSILFGLYLLDIDINGNPNNPKYQMFYIVTEYEVTFKREVSKDDSLYYVITMMNSAYYETDKVVNSNEYKTLNKGSIYTEKEYDNFFRMISIIIVVMGFLILYYSFDTDKTFEFFSLK